MVSTSAPFSALMLSVLVAVIHADDFLSARSEDNFITKEDIEQTLRFELSGMSTPAKIRSIEADLRPMFSALPKNSRGGLETSVVRYALHRYFVHRHGWYMMGLDPAGGAWDGSAQSTILKDRAPAYILSLFEQRQHGQGLGLHELAVFAAVLTDLVHKEASGILHKVYSELQLPTIGPVPDYWSELSVKAYLMYYLIGGNISCSSVEHFEILEKELVNIYPDWDHTNMWVGDFRRTHKFLRSSKYNPFEAAHRDTFDQSVELIQDLGHHFGSFQDLECKALKGRLVDMEYQGTGRVRLSRFYGGGVNGDWTLSESVEYLRNQGVLDETDPGRPSVVIANYINSQTNCLTASGFYGVCCTNECDGLMRHLESEIATPSATPAQIARVVSNLESDTVDAPRNLSTPLLARLDDIARHHRGEIPLHGRLFAQWMHHAYPRECSFPHVSGTTSPMSPDDWMALYGIDNVEATMEVMQHHHARVEEESVETEGGIELPWQHVEELVTREETSSPGSAVKRALRVVMALGAVSSFVVPLWRASKVVRSGSGVDVSDKQLLV